MFKDLNIFKSIDTFIFRYIEVFRASNVFQNISSKFYSLEEKQQMVVSHTMSAAVFFLPILIIFTLFASNCSLRNEIGVKKDIISTIRQIEREQSKFNSAQRIMVTFAKVATEKDANSFAKKIADKTGLDSSNITVEAFTANTVSEDIKRVEFNLKVRDIKNNDLANIADELIKSKIQIAKIDLAKNKTKNTIEGTLELLTFGRE